MRQAEIAQFPSQTVVPDGVKSFLHIKRHSCNAPVALSSYPQELAESVHMLGRLFVLKVSALPVVEEARVTEMILHPRGNYPLEQLAKRAEQTDWTITGGQLAVLALLWYHDTDSRLPHEWKVANQETDSVELSEDAQHLHGQTLQ
jgi:hypothetical protein